MPRVRNGRALERANAIETEDINAPLMRQMKDLSIKLSRIVVKSFEEKNETHAEETTTSSKSSVVSEPIAVAGTSRQAKRRGQQPTKKAVESSMSHSDETDSDESQPNATASKSQPAKRRGRPPKMNVKPKKRALRSNSSVDDVSFETPERRTKRKRHIRPANTSQALNSTDDEQEMAGTKNISKKVTHRRTNFRSTDEDDSISRVDNESMEMTRSDTSESMLVTGEMAQSTMVRGEMPHLDLTESSHNDMTPLLSAEIDSPEPKSQNSSPKSQNSVILLGHGPNTATQNIMDKLMEETPRNAPKSNKNRREQMNTLKSTFGKIVQPSAPIDYYDQNVPEQVGESSISSNGRGSQDIVNETAEDVEKSENVSTNLSGSIFDTLDEMESDDVETVVGVSTSGMNVSDENVGEKSVMSVEENNNVKEPSKQTANVVQSINVHHQQRGQEIVATVNEESTAVPKNVINELKAVLKDRNERKNANESQSETFHGAVRDEGSSNSSTMVKNSTDDENDIIAHENCAELIEYPPIGENKRRFPAAPTPYRKISDELTMENAFDDEMSGPSTSALKVSVSKPKNKRKMPPIDVCSPDGCGPSKIPAKIPTYTNHGFLEESYYDTPTDGIFVFNAKPDEVNVAMDSFHPGKRRRIIQIEPDEVIIIERSKKRAKKRTTRKILKRRVSD